MANPADLLAALKEDEELMERLERAVFSSAQDYQRSVTQAMDDAVADLLTDADDIVRPTVENVKKLDSIEAQLPDILEGTGLEHVADDIVDKYRTRLDTLDNMVSEAGIEGATGIDFRNQPEINEEINRFVSNLDNATPEVEDIVRNEIIKFRSDLSSGTGVRFRALKETLITKANILPRYAGTVGNTQLAAVDRTGRILQADKAGINHMKYMGVVDGLTRPFCRRMVNVVKPIQDWQEMQNNVDPQPVSKYCGGWNCRHRLIMWRPEWDEDGQTTQRSSRQSRGANNYEKKLERAKNARGYNFTDPAVTTHQAVGRLDNELKEKWSKRVGDNFDDQEFKAVRKYTGGDYQRINRQLREEPDNLWAETADDVKNIDGAMEKSVSKFDEDVVTYRGLDTEALDELGIDKNNLDVMKGQRISDDAFMSTSISPNIASGFAPNGVIVKVLNEKGQDGIYTAIRVQKGKATPAMSKHMREKEFLLPRGERLEILDTEEWNGRPVLLARRVPAD